MDPSFVEEAQMVGVLRVATDLLHIELNRPAYILKSNKSHPEC